MHSTFMAAMFYTTVSKFELSDINKQSLQLPLSIPFVLKLLRDVNKKHFTGSYLL